MRPGEAGSDARAAPGLLASLRGLGTTALGIVRTRLQLLANDLEEQRIRALQMVVLGAVALFCGAVGLLLVSAWIVVALWDHYRLWTLAVLALLYFIACGVALAVLRSKAAERPKVFSTSLAELDRDEELLRS
jgi:uncharacterized membrane protein YqjE